MNTNNGTETEKWAVHPEYGSYEVSTNGRVRTIRTGKVLVAALPPKRRYLIVNLGQGGGERISVAVHRLVLETWGEAKPSSKHEARHLNGVPTDNRVENLCWGTASENSADQVRHGRINIKGLDGTMVQVTPSLLQRVRSLSESMDALWVASFCNVPKQWVNKVVAGTVWATV